MHLTSAVMPSTSTLLSGLKCSRIRSRLLLMPPSGFWLLLLSTTCGALNYGTHGEFGVLAWIMSLLTPRARDLLDAIMTRYPTSGVRFAIFLCSSFWALLVLGTNIAANMIPFGADSTLLLPRYINITRGQFLGLVLAWAVNPWKILHSAQTFTNFLGGYIIVSDLLNKIWEW